MDLSLGFCWREKMYIRVYGKYLYITNLYGSKQALFSCNAKAIFDLISCKGLVTINSIAEQLSLENTEKIEKVIEALEEKGFIGGSTVLDSKEEALHAYAVNRDILDLLDAEFALHPQPLFVNIETTENCNLQCVHCYNVKSINYLDYQSFCSIVDQVSAMQALFIVLTGGEVFTHPYLQQMLSYCEKKDLIVSILTNATLDRYATIVPFASIIKEIRVSIYSLMPSIHDAITGVQGSLSAALATIDVLRQSFIVTIATPLMKYNSDCITEIKQYAAERNMDVVFSLGIIAKSDGTCSNIDCRLCRDEYIRCYKELLEPNQSLKRYSDSNKRMLCMGGINSLCISARGNIHLCLTLKSLSMGSIFNKTVEAIWKQSPILNYIRSLNRNQAPQCESCTYQQYCRFCLADNYNENGNLLQVNEQLCSIRKEIIGGIHANNSEIIL